MNARWPSKDEDSSVGYDRIVDRACDRFEARLNSGRTPRIECYLLRSPRKVRTALFRELLLLDIAYRGQRGEQVSPEDYYVRFPRCHRAITRILRKAERLPPAFPRLGILTQWAAETLAKQTTKRKGESGEPVNKVQLRGTEGCERASTAGCDSTPFRLTSVPMPEGGESHPQAGLCPERRAFGDYEILQSIGRGGMGVVYLARQTSADRIVALKIIRRDRYDNLSFEKRQEWLERFRREAKAAARVQNDSVVTIYDVGEVDGEHFYSMRYVEGRSLADRLQEGPLDAHRAAAYLERMARATQAVHTAGIVHRDINPRNILIDADGRPYLSDFGLAKWANGKDAVTTDLEMCIGTPSYMAPEQVQAAGRASWQSDIYSLGASLYEMLTGRPPFHAADSLETMRQVIMEEPVPPRSANPAIDRDLELICLKCLQKEASGRYTSAGQLADELRNFLDGKPLLHTRPVSPLTSLFKWCRRNPALALSIFGVASLLVAVGMLGVLYGVNRARAESNLAEAKRQTQRQACEWALDFGLNLCERGDGDAGVMWLTRALEASVDSSEEFQWGVRANLAGWRSVLPSLCGFIEQGGNIRAVTFGANDPMAVTIDDDGTVKLWDVQAGKLLPQPWQNQRKASAAIFSGDGQIVLMAGTERVAWKHVRSDKSLSWPHGHKDTIYALAVSSDGTRLVTASLDKTARIWNTRTGELIGEPLKHQGPIVAVAISPNGATVLTGSTDSTARLWNSSTGHPIGPSLHHEGTVMAVAYSPDSTMAVTGSKDNAARIWSTESCELLVPPLMHDGAVGAVAVSPDGKLVLTGSSDKTTRLWRTANGKSLSAPLAQQGEASAVGFLGDGTRFLGASADGIVRIWQTDSLLPDCAPLRHTHKVIKHALSSDGKRVLTGSADGKIRLWELPSSLPLCATLPHKDALYAVCFSPDGTRILTASFDGSAKIWDAASYEPLVELRHGAEIVCAAFSPDGKTAVTGSADNTAQLWDASTGQSRGPPLRHGGRIHAAAFSPDGARLVTASRDHTATIWNTQTGSALGSPLRHGGQVLSVAYSHDGKKVITGSADGKAQLFDVSTGESLCEPLYHGGFVMAVAFGPDGNTVATVGTDATAQLWNGQRGTPLGRRLQHHGPVSALAYSPDGRLVATASSDKTTRIWVAATGEALCPPLQHNGAVYAVAFSPNGRLVATASADGNARLWDPWTGKPIGPRFTHRYAVHRLAFSPDGSRLLTGSDHMARLWRVPRPIEGDSERISLWVQALEGLEILPSGELSEADAAQWRNRQVRLAQIGGPPMP